MTSPWPKLASVDGQMMGVFPGKKCYDGKWMSMVYQSEYNLGVCPMSDTFGDFEHKPFCLMVIIGSDSPLQRSCSNDHFTKRLPGTRHVLGLELHIIRIVSLLFFQNE